MTDTINARFTLGTKATFLQMKADQKAIYDESKTHQLRKDYDRLTNDWANKRPGVILNSSGNLPSLTDWRNSKPAFPWILEVDARAMNIVYGMLKGHSYRDIENTYRKGNGPDRYAIRQVLGHYGIDESRFIEICGEIDYE